MQSLKQHTQTLLKRLGVYYRLKESYLYDLYWMVFDRSLIDDERKQGGFYTSLLDGFRKGDLIFDVGANQGYKTRIFLRLGARVLAVDPDEVSKETLERSFLRTRLRPRPVTIVNKALSDKNATEVLWIDEPGSAKNSLSRKWVDALRVDDARFGQPLSFERSKNIDTTTLDDLMSQYGKPFFIKIDVEGHELNVLRGLRRAVPYLSFEVNLPEFRSEGLKCVELLAQLDANGTFNYAVDCRDGLLEHKWMKPAEFMRVLSDCKAPSIEVFWKTVDQRGLPKSAINLQTAN